MPTKYVVGCLIAAAILTGCSKAKITTELRADGSWTRTLALSGKQQKEGAMQMGGGIEDAFMVPTGAEWKSKEDKKDDDRTLTFNRTLAAGAIVKGDLSLKGDQPNQVLLVNEVSIRSSGPGRYEYRETLHYAGPKPEGIANLKPEDLAEIKASLPKALATDENAKALAMHTATLALPMMFGPGDPLIAVGLFHPDLAERRATQKIGSVLLKALEEQFGSKMTLAERREIAQKLVRTSLNSSKPATPDPSAGPPSSGKGAGLTPLLFVLKAPGRIVSHNGELDDFTGEIYWGLYPEAAALKDVVLTAVCEPSGK